MSLKASKEVFNLVFKNRFAHRLMNVIFLSFVFFFFFNIATIFFNLNRFFEKTAQEVVFYAFVDKSVNDVALKKLSKTMSLWHETKLVNIISEEEGLKLLKKSLGKDAEILKSLEKNPLPVTLEITLNPNFVDPISISSFKNKLSKYREISWYDSTEKYIGPILQMKDLFRKIFAGSLLFLLALIFISFRFSFKTLFLRFSGELKLLKLLGAGEYFIMLPLIIEGFLETLIASLIASAGNISIYNMLKTNLHIFGIQVEPLQFSYYALISLIFSIFSSLGVLSIRKIREI